LSVVKTKVGGRAFALPPTRKEGIGMRHTTRNILKQQNKNGNTVNALVEISSQAVPHEQAFLGSLLICDDPSELKIALSMVTPDDFTYEPHALIYKAIAKVAKENQTVNALDVVSELERMGVAEKCGGLPYLMKLMELTHTVSPVSLTESLILHSIKQFVVKSMAKVEADIVKAGNFNEALQPIREIIATAESKLASVTSHVTKDVVTGKEAFISWLDSLAQAEHSIPTGIAELDELLSPIEGGSLILVGARPSVGKTAFLLQFAVAVVRSGKSCLFLSYEMPTKQLVQRIIAQNTFIPYSLLSSLSDISSDRASKLMQKVMSFAEELSSYNLFFIDKPMPLPAVKLNLYANPVDVIFVDYLQQIPPPSKREHRYQEVGDIVRELKRWAKEFNCVVVAAVQLSRATEARAEKRPTLADLRESGDLEAEADVVILFHQLNDTKTIKVNEMSAEGRRVDMIVAKNRNGMVGTVSTVFLAPFVRFVCDYD